MGSLLIAAALAMLVIYAGVHLLIHVKKEALDGLYKWAAWGFIVAGKLLLVLIAIACIIMCCRVGMKMHNKKSKHGYEMYGHMGHDKMHKKMKCDGQQMHQGCMGQMDCGKMDGSCGMKNSCPMMNGGKEENCCANRMMMMNCESVRTDTLKRRK